jgi:SSS family solute:Na+ symporter
VVWGLFGTGFAILMIRAKSALDVWWQVSGIFGGGILGLFLLSLLGIRLRLWQGLIAIGVSIAVISWGTFARNLPETWKWAEASFEPIIVGAVGTAALMIAALILGWGNRRMPVVAADASGQEGV